VQQLTEHSSSKFLPALTEALRTCTFWQFCRCIVVFLTLAFFMRSIYIWAFHGQLPRLCVSALKLFCPSVLRHRWLGYVACKNSPWNDLLYVG